MFELLKKMSLYLGIAGLLIVLAAPVVMAQEDGTDTGTGQPIPVPIPARTPELILELTLERIPAMIPVMPKLLLFESCTGGKGRCSCRSRC